MNILSKFRRLLNWLAEPVWPGETGQTILNWWDLPPHHPCS